jgi:hypothetical protein
MKAQLTFDLDDQSDAIAHIRAIKALDMALVLNSIIDDLRIKLKYDNLSPERYEQTEHIRDHILDVLDNYGVDINSLLL